MFVDKKHDLLAYHEKGFEKSYLKKLLLGNSHLFMFCCVIFIWNIKTVWNKVVLYSIIIESIIIEYVDKIVLQIIFVDLENFLRNFFS